MNKVLQETKDFKKNYIVDHQDSKLNISIKILNYMD